MTVEQHRNRLQGGGAASACSRSLWKGGETMYLFGLTQLFAVCGVPAAIVVGVVVLIRVIYVLATRRKE